jgi:hypothetical protein
MDGKFVSSRFGAAKVGAIAYKEVLIHILFWLKKDYACLSQ